MPHEVIEVQAPTLSQFMGATATDPDDRVIVEGRPDTGLRAIMFTDIEGSTDISTSHGDAAAVELVGRHNDIVRSALDRFDGHEVKHTGDGLFASFVSVTKAVQATVAIQRSCADDPGPAPHLAIKIGLSAGEPVEDSKDLFGASVNLAARICAHARGGQTLAAGTVKDLALGKSIHFIGQGAVGLKGFPDPIPLYEVDWQEGGA
jgi:class 3 adenylate cyclase